MKIGIIGGSGLDDPNLIQAFEEKEAETPYGKPSSKITLGKINNVEVAVISRHGKNHEISPSNVNNRANIYALKALGCTHILSTTAVGSLRKDIQRGDFIILDQFIDFTRNRKTTFHESFPDGPVHTQMAQPFNEDLRKTLILTSKELNFPTHESGTVITIEGPRFSTRAESKIFRAWGADVINMSIAPEATLANEAQIPYATIAMSTDFDCLFEDIKPVSWEEISKTFAQNAERVKKLLILSISKIANQDESLIKSKIRTIPHFPKQGIMFRDITTLLKDKEGMERVIEIFYNRYKDKKIDLIAGIESRGFILGGILAMRLGVGFVPIRKPGKLPAEIIRQEYQLEYGTDAVEIHKDSISPGQKVLIIDDLLATGGTAQATAILIEKLAGKIEEISFVIELPELLGRKKLSNWPVFSIVKFDGE
jgi:5'-methylthioadenosine phosphorylase